MGIAMKILSEQGKWRLGKPIHISRNRKDGKEKK